MHERLVLNILPTPNFWTVAYDLISKSYGQLHNIIFQSRISNNCPQHSCHSHKGRSPSNLECPHTLRRMMPDTDTIEALCACHSSCAVFWTAGWVRVWVWVDSGHYYHTKLCILHWALTLFSPVCVCVEWKRASSKSLRWKYSQLQLLKPKVAYKPVPLICWRMQRNSLWKNNSHLWRNTADNYEMWHMSL